MKIQLILRRLKGDHMLTRQHAETEVVEVVGLVCESLLAVPGERADIAHALYLKASGMWLRMFVDAGVFFLDESQGPDPEDDLAAGQEYVDLGNQLGSVGSRIQALRFHDATLTLRFENGVSILVRETDAGMMTGYHPTTAP